MVLKIQNIIINIIVVTFILPTILQTHASNNCEQSCGTTKHIPFPFGFSSGCQIQLNCSTNGTVFIGEFPVEKFTSDTILVNIPAKCGRPLTALQYLFNKNYAPTVDNGILLQNCSTPVTGCLIPTTMVKTHLEFLDCGSSKIKDTISCYSENKSSSFIHYSNIRMTNCQSLISAVSTWTSSNSSAVSLEVQVVQLGWWLQGDCRCSDDATCTPITSPINGQPGYRCSCNDGFLGDGFLGGLGCRKESGCNILKYMAGHCGGTARVGMLIVGVAVVILLMVSIGLVCYFRRCRSNYSKPRKRTQRKLCETKGLGVTVYPYKDIEKATHSFSEKRRLGTGAYGTVYSGKLHNDDKWVAIKRIKNRADTDSIDQVMNEIKLLSSVSHPNLVRLLGCSIENNEQVLVYEFMPNGTLLQHLHKERGSGLAWPVRLTIALETAQAVAYLHSAVNPPIYHRDIKSSNILLDYNYQTKVADFGLSRLGMIETSHISTAPQGTPGYLDPQYHQNFHLSDRSDVYSFGVVLIEMITALKVIDFTRTKNEVNLATLAIDRIGNGRLDDIIDPFMVPNLDESNISSIHKVAELAFRCLAFCSDMRPSMTEVAAELEQINSISKCASAGVQRIASSLEESSSKSDEIPLRVEKPVYDIKRLFGSLSSQGSEKNFSPVSVQDSWLSDRSSPSSNNLISHEMQ